MIQNPIHMIWEIFLGLSHILFWYYSSYSEHLNVYAISYLLIMVMS